MPRPASSQASQLPQGNAFQVWELACLRQQSNGRHLTKQTHHRPESKTPARGWRFAFQASINAAQPACA
ncbi:hypothetical protein DD985_08500 [Pseudomonas sp. HMWF011]|nr:hypothetical protein C2U56_07505 [Pseudomonas fluorescens]PTT11408.1 hypothetical protein DBR14_13585 [Pseudomonas sp. HMWF034]PVV74196.1 hypothetical protein DD985_08500 [Pseudomonas sp. HMWF011]